METMDTTLVRTLPGSDEVRCAETDWLAPLQCLEK